MKALTLWQPWATLVAMEVKKIETRCWSTKYRGELAIHSAAKLPVKWLGRSAQTEPFRDELAEVFGARRDRDDRTGSRVDTILKGLPAGKVLCVVNLYDVVRVSELENELTDREMLFGNYEDGRYAWMLKMIDVFEPGIAAKGNRQLWNWER